MSIGAYGELIRLFELEQGIKDHPDTLGIEITRRRWILPDKKVSAFEVQVPDLSVSDFIDIAKSGVWPLGYYKRIDESSE